MNDFVEPLITIRDVGTTAELREVERLQRRVWRVSDLDVVPLSQLVAARESGGVLLGAFDGGRMVGFVYGFVGRERGAIVHHSHMLAVEPECRGRSVGCRLKCEQRLRVLEQGIEVMTWTFDPLRSLNANFNFGKLGVVADLYHVDFYGPDAESFLHKNGTDRLWVSWHLSSERVERRLAGEKPQMTGSIPVLVTVCETGAPLLRDMNAAFASEKLTIEIPRDIGPIERESPELARNWRNATRQAFTAALGAGFRVVDFVPGEKGPHATGSYVLSRETAGDPVW